MSVWITNIQRMCFDDGPGIRTTVFMKGCSIHCPWCSNPENIDFKPEAYERNGAHYIYGKEYSASELFDLLIKDKKFWEPDGGVTFSGGEALMQSRQLEEVWKLLKLNEIHIAAETALFVPQELLEIAISYIDYFIVDVKILEKAVCHDVLGGDAEQYLNNVEILYQSGKLGLFRVPCCPEYTFTDPNQILLHQFLKQHRNIPVQLFAIHELGAAKYECLNKNMWRTKGVEEQSLSEYCMKLKTDGINAEIIHI